MKFRSQPNTTLTPTDRDKSLKVGTKDAAHSSNKGSNNLCFRDPRMSWALTFWSAESDKAVIAERAPWLNRYLAHSQNPAVTAAGRC